MVVVDALAMPVRGLPPSAFVGGLGLAVDGETEGFVPDDDSVGRRRLPPPRGPDGHSVGVGEPERAVVETLHVESALVHQPVMGRAEQNEVVEGGLAALGPVPDVVTVQALGGGAAGEAAAAVAVREYTAYGWRDAAGAAPDAERLAAGCSSACAAIAASSALRMRAPISGGNRPCSTTVPSSSCQKVKPRFSCWVSARSISSVRFARQYRRTNFSTCCAVPCRPMLRRSASFSEVAMRVRARTLE